MAANKIDWTFLHRDAAEAFTYAQRFLKNPMQAIRKPPRWHWPSLLIFQGATSAAAGALTGFVALSFVQILIGFLLIPFSALITTVIVSGLIYYFTLFAFNRELDFRGIFTLVYLAGLPLLASHIVSPLLPPSTLLGISISCVLLLVGLVDHFHLPRKPMVRLIGGLFMVYLLFWVIQWVRTNQRQETFYREASPQSLKILEEEFKEK